MSVSGTPRCTSTAECAPKRVAAVSRPASSCSPQCNRRTRTAPPGPGLGPDIAELRDWLATADGSHEMLTLLEEKLMRRLRETTGLGLVRHTSSVIATTSGAVAIGDLSVAAGVSSTHLAQRFKEFIGVTPKRLARTYRFAATVFAINPAGPIDWGDLAAGAGYCDQAHFGHEFRAFTGLTPTRYVEVRRRFLREHPGHVLDSWPLPAD